MHVVLLIQSSAVDAYRYWVQVSIIVPQLSYPVGWREEGVKLISAWRWRVYILL